MTKTKKTKVSIEASTKNLQLIGGAFQAIGASKFQGAESKAIADILCFLQKIHTKIAIVVAAQEAAKAEEAAALDKAAADEADRELLRKADEICNRGNSIGLGAVRV